MSKDVHVVFRADQEDRRMIAIIAERLKRNQSDAIRLIIRRTFLQMIQPGAGDLVYPIPEHQGAADEKTV